MPVEPAERLREIASAYWLSRSLHVTAELGVADAVPDRGIEVGLLAELVGADASALRRVLFLLAGHGVFALDEETVRHTPASRLLREDEPGSLRSMVRMFGIDLTWAAYGELASAVRTGAPAIEQVAPEGFFAHLADHPGTASLFASAMAAKSRAQIAAVGAAYEFGAFSTIADVGGGRGHLLEAVLDRAPGATGLLFDLPHVVAEAAAAGHDRMDIVGGDFFTDPLPAADGYLLSQVLHDWGDDEARAILTAIRHAAAPGARLLVIEAILSASPQPQWASMLDIHMLVLLTGRERTGAQYAELLASSGFTLERVIDTTSEVQILEAVAS